MHPHRYSELPHPFFYYDTKELREFDIQIGAGLRGPMKCSALVNASYLYGQVRREPVFITDVLSPQLLNRMKQSMLDSPKVQ